jgi:hypothetical protein
MPADHTSDAYTYVRDWFLSHHGKPTPRFPRLLEKVGATLAANQADESAYVKLDQEIRRALTFGTDVEAPAKHAAARARVLAALGGQTLRGRDIADATGDDYDRLRHVLGRMVKEGILSNDHRGYRKAGKRRRM